MLQLLVFTLLKLLIVILILTKFFQVLTKGRCTCVTCLVGKTVIVTGGSSGIGYETVCELAARGCRIIIADKIVDENIKYNIIRKTGNTNIILKYIDLASLSSVRKFAADIMATEKRLDILINNAGMGCITSKYTEDGLHPTMQVNHFGPFLLTHLLLGLLKKSAPSKIIFCSSMIAFLTSLSPENLNFPANHSLNLFSEMEVYANSKLCNVITANGFSEKLKCFGITVNSLHPGIVNTSLHITFEVSYLLRQLLLSPSRILFKTPREGAQTAVHLALSPELQNVTGKHFWDCKQFFMPSKAKNRTFCKQIWTESEKLAGLTEEDKLELHNEEISWVAHKSLALLA